MSDKPTHYETVQFVKTEIEFVGADKASIIPPRFMPLILNALENHQQILIHGMTVDDIIRALLDSNHVQSDETVKYLFDRCMTLSCELAKELQKRGIKVD